MNNLCILKIIIWKILNPKFAKLLSLYVMLEKHGTDNSRTALDREMFDLSF